jgi:PAS domain S-box-containing protein
MNPNADAVQCAVDLDAVITTDDLSRRPILAPDHATESRALVDLAHALARTPEELLQKLADTILVTCRAHSSAVSLLTDGGEEFYWPAIAGEWATDADGGTPPAFGPCGTILDRKASLLMSRPQRHFTYLNAVKPVIDECLLVPFYLDGRAVGAIWAISHDESARFDAEDLRVLEILAAFATVAYRQAQRSEASLWRSDEAAARELADSMLLQSLAVKIANAKDGQQLFQQILDAATGIMHSQYGSLQLLESAQRSGQNGLEALPYLRLLAYRGFTREAAAHWKRVRLDSATPCGRALSTGQRIIVPDVETCDYVAGTVDLEMFRDSGIRSVQTTPLFSAAGVMLGMLSTHWRVPHQPSERDLRLLDIVARQAADLIEPSSSRPATTRARAKKSAQRTGHPEGDWRDLRDVNERLLVAGVRQHERAQEALRLAEAKSRALFESIDDGFCVIELIHNDRGKVHDLIFREVNLAFQRHTGLQDVVGKRLSQVLPNFERFWIDVYTRVTRTGQPARSEHYVGNLDRWYSVQQSRIGGAESRFIAVVFEDITKRKRQEAEQTCLLKLSDELRPLTDAIAVQHTASRILGEHLGVSRAFYYAVEREAQGFIHVVARDFCADTNMSSLIGRHAQAAYGKLVFEKLSAGETVVAPDVKDLSILTASERDAYLALSIRAFVMVPLIKNGEYVGGFATLHLQPRTWRDDEVALVEELAERTWAAVERTRAEAALRASEERLQETDRRKDEFLAMLAHELRNPLAAIRTCLELIRVAGSSPESVARVRATMERQIGHMVRLIDDLLDASRITTGKIQLRRAPALLADIMHGAVEASRSAFDAAGIRLKVNIPDERCVLDVDVTRMVQALSNLLHNAAKFTSAEGHVEFAARFTDTPEAERRVALTVSDDGVGIPQEMLPRIFDLFTQGQLTQGHSPPGLGIGLSLARHLVEMHGGRLEARSDGPGQGSAFTIDLPIPHLSPLADSPLAIAPAQLTRRIVIVDDNEDAAQAMSMLLEELGGQTRVAYDGYAGLEAVAEFRPDAVLLDIGMPGIDGYETCRRIRMEPFGKDVLIVALTGRGKEQDKRQALDAGFDAHVTKPADPVMLQRILSIAGPREARQPEEGTVNV